MATAFISHASQDREVAERICNFLEERGIHCWIAPRNVRPGRRYGEEIVEGIQGADAVVLVLSENANTSTFVEREIERAVSYGKPTLPVRVREVQPSRSLELFISNAHWIDAWKPPMEQYLDRLADSIRSLSSVSGGLGETTWTESRRTTRGETKHKATVAKQVVTGVIVLLLLGLGAAATWWFLGREKPTPAASTPVLAPANVPMAPTIAETKPTATLNASVQPPASPPVERKQEASAAPISESHPVTSPSGGVKEVLAAIANTNGRARDQAIEQNIQRLPQQISVDELLAIINGTYDRDSAIKQMSNRLPTPLKMEEALRILAGTASRQRSLLIETLSSRLPPALTVKELLQLIEQAYGRSDLIKQFVNRLPNPLSIEETMLILDSTASRERFGLIDMFSSRMSQKLSVNEMLAIIEGSYDRNGAIQLLVNRLPNPLSVEETLQVLNNTTSRERSALVGMLNSRIPQKLSPQDMLRLIEGAYDRNTIIKMLVNRLPNPIPFDDLQTILAPTSSRERFALIEILHSHAPAGLSSAEISALVQGSYDLQGAEKLLRK